MFWFGVLAGALLLAGTIRASNPSRLPDLLGVWDGFYLADDGATGPIRTNVTLQESRRLKGDGELFDLDGSDVPYRFAETLARPDFLIGTGVTATGQLVFHAGLATYAGRGGDAGVMAPEYQFLPARGGASGASALLLHPFPGVQTPDLSGSGQGSFVSLPDQTFKGIGKVAISARNTRGSFAGRVEFFHDPTQSPIFSWPLLATASNDRRVVMISQGKTGRILYDGVVVPAQDATSKTFIGGFFRLIFTEGGTTFGAFNFNLTQ
jgi:hypothetical protein